MKRSNGLFPGASMTAAAIHFIATIIAAAGHSRSSMKPIFRLLSQSCKWPPICAYAKGNHAR